MSQDYSVVNYFAPQAGGNSCSQLRQYASVYANNLGYSTSGIGKGSFAAQAMSYEARASGGGVRSMREGGISASLQSIGATGRIKSEAESALCQAFNTLGGRQARGIGHRGSNTCQIQQMN